MGGCAAPTFFEYPNGGLCGCYVFRVSQWGVGGILQPPILRGILGIALGAPFGLAWERPGNVLGASWGRSGDVMGASWEHPILWTSQWGVEEAKGGPEPL